MPITDHNAIYMAVPEYELDNVIGVLTGSFAVAAPTPFPPTTASDTKTTGFGGTCYFQGIYSTDAGTTWNDFGAQVPYLATPGMPVFQTLDVNGYSIGNSFTVNAIDYYNAVTAAGTAYNVIYRVALFAKNTQGAVTPTATTEILQYSSAQNYQKIYLSGSTSFNLTATVAQTATVTHNLGYVPRVRAFFQETSGSLRMMPLWYTPALLTTDQQAIEARVTTTDVTFFIDATLSTRTVNGNIEYRIYLDS